jgi:hypothetical protein
VGERDYTRTEVANVLLPVPSVRFRALLSKDLMSRCEVEKYTGGHSNDESPIESEGHGEWSPRLGW